MPNFRTQTTATPASGDLHMPTLYRAVGGGRQSPHPLQRSGAVGFTMDLLGWGGDVAARPDTFAGNRPAAADAHIIPFPQLVPFTGGPLDPDFMV